jgi:hypothetical protein
MKSSKRKLGAANESPESGAMIVERGVAEGRICPVPRDRALPLSFAQQRLWLSDQVNSSAVRTAGVQLDGVLIRWALRAALDRIVARHEVLRTTFPGKDGEPVQVIGAADSGFALIEQDVEGDWAVEQLVRQEALDSFDLSSGPLIRGRAVASVRTGTRPTDHAAPNNFRWRVDWNTNAGAGRTLRDVRLRTRRSFAADRAAVRRLRKLAAATGDTRTAEPSA